MKKMSKILTFLGSLPFGLCALLLVFGVRQIPVLGQVEQIVSVYGLVIAAFMAGSHWGQALNLTGRWSVYLPILSNVNAIFLWLGFLLLSFKLWLILLMMSFLASMMIDRALLKKSIINDEYYKTRCLVTLIVVVALFVVGVF